MSKKIAVISAVLLTAAVTAIILLSNLAASNEIFPPENVTVYLPEKSVVETIGTEDFLRGCVYGRMPRSGVLYEKETIKAIAAVQNTMIMNSIRQNNKSENMGADFSVNEDFPYISDSDCAINHPNRKIIDGVLEETGFLESGNYPAEVTMCGISAGFTDASGDSPALWLPCDALADGYLSNAAFTPKEVRRLMGLAKNPTITPDKWFGNTVCSDSGTLISIELAGRKFTGEQLRSSLNLRSTAISVSYAEDKFFFACKGLGNNKGMSINAANVMAKQGKTAGEILEFFFPDCTYQNPG